MKFTPTKEHEMSVSISTTSYEFSHGKAPRGTGTWAFLPSGPWRSAGWVFFTGTFTEARRQATAWAREQGIGRLEVGA